MGVEAVQISKEVRQLLGAPEDAGVLVNSVKSDSGASEAGIKPGDIIVEVAGQKVKNVGTIRRALADKEAGQTVPIVVMRDRKSTTLTAKLRERPKHEAFLGDAFDMAGGKGFVFQGGEMHKDLEKLSERLNDLEKRLQSLESRR